VIKGLKRGECACARREAAGGAAARSSARPPPPPHTHTDQPHLVHILLLARPRLEGGGLQRAAVRKGEAPGSVGAGLSPSRGLGLGGCEVGVGAFGGVRGGVLGAVIESCSGSVPVNLGQVHQT